MEASAIIVIFKNDLNEVEHAEIVKHVSELPGVESVQEVESWPADQILIERERHDIERRLLAQLPTIVPPQVRAAIIKAIYVG